MLRGSRSIRCWTSASSASTDESASRASHVTSGVVGSRSRAARSCSSVKCRGASGNVLKATAYGSPLSSTMPSTSKEASIRRLSTRTSAPSAPYAMSSQSARNRSWPGVPNRYSTTPPGRLIRPKSMATVVVAFSRTPSRSSTCAEASLSRSSVCSGRISDTESIRVVLPTPKGPATRIFTNSRAVSGRWMPLGVLEGA